MRNKEVVEAMKAVEENLKQDLNGQLAKYTALLQQYMVATDL